MSKVGRRVIARDACTWCGHTPHADVCGGKIRVKAKPETNAPCPCARQRYVDRRTS